MTINRKYLFRILLSVIVIAVSMIRVQWLDIPLERDEGEYAYIGQLLLQGIPPYEGAYTMKLPGTAYMYALFMLLFGQTTTAIHLGLLLVNSGTIILVALLARRLKDLQAGIYAAALYAILSIGASVLGFAAHANHFVVFFALAGILVMLSGLDPVNCKKLFLSGIFFGLSILMKQPGIFFAAFAVLWTFYALCRTDDQWKATGTMIAGISAPLLLLISVIVFSGTFDRFWLFVVRYAGEYSSTQSFQDGLYEFTRRTSAILKEFPLLWVIVFLSISIAFKNTKHRKFLIIYKIGQKTPGF